MADADESLADWRGLRARLDVRELAVITQGWQLGFRADDAVHVARGTWSGAATLGRLAALVGALPATTRVVLVSTPRRLFEDTDVRWLHAATGRDVALA